MSEILDLKLFATQIQWDTDGEEVDLPDSMEIPKSIWEEGDIEDISDWISDETGFCHDGFSLYLSDTLGNDISTNEIKERMRKGNALEKETLWTALSLVDNVSKDCEQER